MRRSFGSRLGSALDSAPRGAGGVSLLATQWKQDLSREMPSLVSRTSGESGQGTQEHADINGGRPHPICRGKRLGEGAGVGP